MGSDRTLLWYSRELSDRPTANIAMTQQSEFGAQAWSKAATLGGKALFSFIHAKRMLDRLSRAS